MPPGRGARRAVTSGDRDRSVGRRTPRERILIVCEGEETEPNYFNGLIAFHLLNTVTVASRIEVRGTGRQGPSLVAFAQGLQRSGPDAYAEIWCVFDKDSTPPDDFNRGVLACAGHKYLRVAWTNEAWELWYVLHFLYLDNAPPAGPQGTARAWYRRKLDELLLPLGRTRYDKSDRGLYRDLGTQRRDQALARADKLQADNKHHGASYHLHVPGTTVHELVRRLLELAPENTA
jgi:hypothetical protein